MDFTKLNNLTQLDLSLVDSINSEEIIPTVIETTNTLSEGYFGLAVMFGSFIILSIMLFKQDGDIRLDITRSMMMSSGFSFILGTIMIVTGISTNLIHVIWFLVIFATLYILMLGIKKKGQ